MVVVRGDRALAEPVAAQLAAEIAAAWGVEAHRARRPEELADLVADLRTMSLFEPGKVVLAVETALLADRGAAGELIAAARAALPFTGGAEDLTETAREAALMLLRVVRLHDLDPAAAPAEQILGELPDRLFSGGRGKAAAAETVRAELAPLLAAAVAAGLRGAGQEDVSLVADLLRDGLPERHLLVLVESAVADGHPLLEAIARRGGVVDAGRLAVAKGGRFEGLEPLVAEIARESGAEIRRDAVEELGRRTLRTEEYRRGGSGGVDADSAARFGAELRKLANLAGGRPITRELVAANVEDRGQEEVWPILDALGDGKAGEALAKIRRRLAGADDPLRERLSMFALLAGHARLLAAVGGALAASGAPPDERSFPRFKERIAPALQGEIDGVEVNPLAKLHPYRLHKVYLATGRHERGALARMAARTLETERRLKGDSDDAEAALAAYVMALAGRLTSGPPPAAGSRARAAGGGRR